MLERSQLCLIQIDSNKNYVITKMGISLPFFHIYKDFNSSQPENKSPELFPKQATVNFVLEGLVYSPNYIVLVLIF